MPKTSFTNADLGPARFSEKGYKQPEDVVTPWKLSNPEDQRSELARLSGMDVNGGASIDSVLDDAKGAMANFDKFQEGNKAVDDWNARNRDNASIRALSPYEELKHETIGRVDPMLKKMVGAATLPAAFASGPVGVGAGALLGAEALDDLVTKPGIGTAINAGVSLIPGIRYLRGAGKAIPEALPALSATEGAAKAARYRGYGDAARGLDDVSTVSNKVPDAAYRPLTRAKMPKGEAPVDAPPPAAPQAPDEMSLAQLSGQAQVIDPRRMLPAFGETSATGKFAGQPTLLELAQQVAPPGVNVKSLKGYPSPSGSDAASKAMRQRKHVADSYKYLHEDPR